MAGRGWRIEDAPRLDGRRAVVTGASGGLGFETALGLARRGAAVVLAARDPGRAEAARRRIAGAVPGADVGFARLDLADLASVAAFAAGVVASGPLDVLVCNAGVMAFPTRRTTRDGFEEQFGTNYLGHFALAARLMPALTGAGGAARVVSVASLAHVQGRIDLDDLQGATRYDPWTAYRQSKLAMLIFARELQRRADAADWPLRAVAAHPGWAVTDIISNGPGQGRGGLKPAMMNLAFRLLGQSAADGALPILYAATAPEAEPGGYYGPTGRGERTGPVGPSRVMPQARDAGVARALWDASERLTGVRFETEVGA
ncbi:SDR family oxidoreductase [Lichenibacterium dinghuense]|uniref:SDR family oxidoreductase n=1 Tax=Lichenibacterium dinghuense TaxID=2895977 RepID=UPI001F0064B3|nr:SDR family oxidoreductase [Lichenibacterium sp. 6Y81]